MKIDMVSEFKKLSGVNGRDKELDSYVKEFLYANGELKANELVSELECKIDSDGLHSEKDTILSKLKGIIGVDKPAKTEFKFDPDKKDVPTNKLPKKVLAEEVILDNNKAIIRKITSKEDAIKYGKGTMWSITSTQSYNSFDQYYNERGDNIYYIELKSPAAKMSGRDISKVAVQVQRNGRKTFYAANNRPLTDSQVAIFLKRVGIGIDDFESQGEVTEDASKGYRFIKRLMKKGKSDQEISDITGLNASIIAKARKFNQTNEDDVEIPDDWREKDRYSDGDEIISKDDTDRIEDIAHEVLDLLQDEVENSDDYEWMNFNDVLDMTTDNIAQGVTDAKSIVANIKFTKLGIEEDKVNESPRDRITSLMLFRLYDKSYGDEGNPKTLSVTLNSDDTLSYILYGGWGNSGMPFSLSNLQLKYGLPSRISKSVDDIEDLRDLIAGKLHFGVGSHNIKKVEILNKIPDDYVPLDIEEDERSFVATDDQGDPLFSVSADTDKDARDSLSRQQIDQSDLNSWEKSNRKLDIQEDEDLSVRKPTSKYQVKKTGGSIGEKDRTYYFDDRESAIEYAKSRRKHLSPGERKYYRLKYTASPLKESDTALLEPETEIPAGYVSSGGSSDYLDKMRQALSASELEEEEMDEAPMDRNPLSRYPDQVRALRDIRRMVGSTNDKPIQSTTLSYSDEKSNKYHYFAILQRPDGDYIAANAYARIGYTPKVSVFASGDLDIVRSAYDKKVQAKMDKGYKPGGPRAKGVNESKVLSESLSSDVDAIEQKIWNSKNKDLIRKWDNRADSVLNQFNAKYWEDVEKDGGDSSLRILIEYGEELIKQLTEADEVATADSKDDTDLGDFAPPEDKEKSQDKFDQLNKDINYDKDRIKEGDTVEITAKDSKELIVPPTTVSKVTMIRVPEGEEYLTVTFADGYSYSEEDYTISKYDKNFKDTKNLLNQSYEQYLESPRKNLIDEDLKRIIELSNHKIT